MNGLNVTRTYATDNTGFKGVTERKQKKGKKYTAKYGGKNLGTFRTARIAKAARILAAQKVSEEAAGYETDIGATSKELAEAAAFKVVTPIRKAGQPPSSNFF
ncbi:hypothetical protein sr17257 [Sporisorium reilianum SRZ2]|uniref:Uncharacterized protein n=1 Tax=Sporisorium reilianum (strain SRZ2) TaxID=999809 RepID=E6ZUW3_SPORE|nr:hypothetical protein sr17257 [Sporisorium reilianum SRZ2]